LRVSEGGRGPRSGMNVPLTPVRFLRYAQEQFPRRTAIVCGDLRFNYEEFGERAGHLAGALVKAGLNAGDRVAFLSGNCHRLLEAYYGVVEAGGVLLPLNVRLSREEFAYVLNDAGARFLFFESPFLGLVESFRAKASSIEFFILLDGKPQADWLMPQGYDDLISAANANRPDLMTFDENSVAELFYTSGTSTNPKGVMLSHRNIYLHALNALAATTHPPEPVSLHSIPLFHANGWGIAHTLTLVGGKHVMLRRFDPVEVFAVIERERVTRFSMVPAMAIAFLNAPERHNYDLSSIERISLGGAAPSPTLVREIEEQLHCECLTGYGLTETSPALTTSLAKAGLEWKGEERYRIQSTAGHALPGVEMRLVDEVGSDIPPDHKSVGEILVRADGVMKGYWRQPEATREALHGGWLHTGDLATIDENGYIRIVDRKKDMIISGGENISSLELESVLSAHPSVYEVAVIPVPHEKWGEVPKALIVLKPGSRATESELINFCRSQLAHYKAPRSVEFVETLPRTGTGKILKRELRRKYGPNEETVQHASASQETRTQHGGR
jgi:fatty-acyl-CoA synthase